MNWRFELSRLAKEQLARLPKDAQERIARAIDEMERRDDRQWSNVKALHGAAWKGRYRKRAGPFRIVFEKFPDEGLVSISAILIRAKDTCR